MQAVGSAEARSVAHDAAPSCSQLLMLPASPAVRMVNDARTGSALMTTVCSMRYVPGGRSIEVTEPSAIHRLNAAATGVAPVLSAVTSPSER